MAQYSLGKTLAIIGVAGLFLFFLLLGCNFNQETRDHALARCDSTSVCNCFYFFLEGYNYNEIDTVLVKVIPPQSQSDTLLYPVFPVRSSRGNNAQSFYAILDSEINVHSQLLIIIRGESTHKVENIKLGIVELNAIGSTDYSCEMNGFELDGKVYKDTEITIYK